MRGRVKWDKRMTDTKRLTSDIAIHPDLARSLDILGACILSDRLERDEELIELANSAQIVARHLAPETVIARRDVAEWFESNREALCGLLDDREALGARMAEVADPELRAILLTALYNVAVCDYQMADEEQEVLQLALAVWAPVTLEPSRLAVLDF